MARGLSAPWVSRPFSVSSGMDFTSFHIYYTPFFHARNASGKKYSVPICRGNSVKNFPHSLKLSVLQYKELLLQWLFLSCFAIIDLTQSANDAPFFSHPAESGRVPLHNN
jgi:hypothetical protein